MKIAPASTVDATPSEPGRLGGLSLPKSGPLRRSIERGYEVMTTKFKDWMWAVKKGHPRVAARLWRELNGLPDPEPMPAELVEHFRSLRDDAKERGEK